MTRLISSLMHSWSRWKNACLDGIQSTRYSVNNLSALQALSDRRVDPTALRSAVAAPPPSEWPEIDVVVVSRNSQQRVMSFFESLHSQLYPLSQLHIRVVEQKSTAGSQATWEQLRQHSGAEFAEFKILYAPDGGLGAGRDRAIREGQAAYCLVTSLEVDFTPECLVILVRTALHDSGSSVACWETRHAPVEQTRYYDPVTLETNCSSHRCVLLRRSAYEQAGGYDPACSINSDDVEISYRFRSHGYVLKYVPRAVAILREDNLPAAMEALQMAGKLIGNLRIRLRYGLAADRLAGLMIYVYRFCRPPPFRGMRRLLVRESLKAVFLSCRHARGKGRFPAKHPFRNEGYELNREGSRYIVRSTESAANAPLVSIVTRTYYGRSAFLRQAVQSVFNQTYPAIELLVVEDGGTYFHESAKEFSDLAPSSCRVKYLSLPKVGRSAAGNAGLRAATGRFMMFLDDDDLLFADHLETLVGVLQADPDAAAAYAHAMEVGTDSVASTPGYREKSFELRAVFRQEWDYTLLQQGNFITIQSLLFKRELFETHGGLDPALDLLEDWNLWLRYGYDKRFVYIPKTTSLFRVPVADELKHERLTNFFDVYNMARDRAAVSIVSDKAHHQTVNIERHGMFDVSAP